MPAFFDKRLKERSPYNSSVIASEKTRSDFTKAHFILIRDYTISRSEDAQKFVTPKEKQPNVLCQIAAAKTGLNSI